MSSEGREKKARAQPAVTWKRRTAADGLAVYWVTDLIVKSVVSPRRWETMGVRRTGTTSSAGVCCWGAG